MPLCTWIVEPVHLNSKHPSLQTCPDTAIAIASLRKNDHNSLYKDFNDVTSGSCVSMMKQLMNITVKVGIMFEELQEESMKILKRSEQLQARVGTIKSKTDNFNPVVDIISLDDTLQSTPYKSGQNNSTVTERPKLVQEVFCRIENMPEFQLLDPFKGPEEKTRCQLYSDPNFFFESWCLQVQQEVVKKPLKKKTRAKKEKNKVRQPKQTKKDQLKSKVNSDFLSKGVKTKAGDNDNEKNNENKLDNDVTSLSSKSFVKSIASETPSVISDIISLENPQCEFDDPLPPPPPFNQDWLPPSILSELLPPPPILHCPQSPSNRGSLYKVSNFDASNFPPSPPTPPTLQPAPPPNHNNFQAPAPPPPPPPESFIQTPPKCPDAPVVKKPPLTKQDSRSDLLSAIKKGMKLRKVNEEEKIKSRANEDVACVLFNVEKIMEMRRRALEEADEEEEEDEDEEDWNDD